MNFLEDIWSWLFPPKKFAVIRIGRLDNAPTKKRLTRPRPGTSKGPIIMLLTDEQQVSLTAAFKTAAGNPAKVDGAPQWSSSNPAIVEVLVDPTDPFKCIARRVGPLGLAQVSVQADADLGAGTRPVAATLDLEVVAAEAVSAGIAAGAPETVPPLTPA